MASGATQSEGSNHWARMHTWLHLTRLEVRTRTDNCRVIEYVDIDGAEGKELRWWIP